MYDVIVVLLSVCGWLAGQALIFSKHFSPGAAVSIFSLFLGFIFFFRVWNAVSVKPGVRILGISGPVIFAVLALAAGIFSMAIVKNSPRDAIMLFALSGALLLSAKPAAGKFFDYFELPNRAEPMRKWEPWFVLALLVVSGGMRLYDLANIPAAGIGGEGLVLGNSYGLISKGTGYTPHVGGGTDWPTLTYYMGIFFAQVFGWEVGSVRISSGILGTLSVIAFYFLARQLTSPVSAAISSLMYTVFICHISMSRLFLGPLSLLFLPHILGLGLLLAAARTPKWFLYLAAGLAAGYSLHGYVPGRGVFLILLGWFALMALTRKKLFHKPLDFAVFWIGFIILASPVIYYAIRYPHNYWSYVASVNPNKAAGLQGYINMIKNSVPMYAAMFYIKSAWDVVMHFPYKPLFDPVTGTLFGMGFFMCVFAFWKPVPAMLLMLFLGGMVPTLLGGGSSILPNAQRALLTYPVIFLVCAYAFERAKRVFEAEGGAPARVFIVTAGIIASLWVFQNGFTEYFVRFAPSPVVRNNAGYQYYIMGKEIKKHITAETHVTPFFVGNDSFLLFVPPGKRLDVPPYMDGMLTLSRETNHLLIFGPFYTNTLGFFKACFPNAEIKSYIEDEKYRGDRFYKDFPIYTGGRRFIDQYEPFGILDSIFVPKQDVVDFQTMLVMEGPGKSERVRVFDGSGFAERYSGKKVTLKGAVIVPQESYYTNSSITVSFDLAWKGWSLVFDGKAKALNKQLFADGGVHYFTVSGIVPAAASGDLPLSVPRMGKDMAKEGRVVAIGRPVGVRLFSIPGEKNWDKPYANSYRTIAPNLRMYDGMFMHLPFSLVEKAKLFVPKDGEYEIQGSLKMRSRIKVDGETVYENLNDPTRPVISKKAMLFANKPAMVEVSLVVDFAPIYDRALALYVKGPGMEKQIMAPAEWLSPAD